MSYQLAQLNVARLLHDRDHPAISDFMNGLDEVNAAAEKSEGFIWRLQNDEGNATTFYLEDDPRYIVNLSVWRDTDSLMQFVQSELHLSFLKQRRRWFEKPQSAYAALWWVPAGHRPTVAEAAQRLDHVNAHGASETAFTFREPFPRPDEGAAGRP